MNKYENIKKYWRESLTTEECALLENNVESFIEQQLKDYSQMVTQYWVDERDGCIDVWDMDSIVRGEKAIQQLKEKVVEYDPILFEKAYKWHRRKMENAKEYERIQGVLDKVRNTGVVEWDEMEYVPKHIYAQFVVDKPISTKVFNFAKAYKLDFTEELKIFEKYSENILQKTPYAAKKEDIINIVDSLHKEKLVGALKEHISNNHKRKNKIKNIKCAINKSEDAIQELKKELDVVYEFYNIEKEKHFLFADGTHTYGLPNYAVAGMIHTQLFGKLVYDIDKTYAPAQVSTLECTRDGVYITLNDGSEFEYKNFEYNDDLEITKLVKEYITDDIKRISYICEEMVK